MGLILSGGPTFAYCTGNLTGTPVSPVGTNFSAGANNADGAAVSVLSALAHDVQYFVVGIGGINLATADGQCLLDVLYDPAGGTSWSPLINDLVCGFTSTPASAVGLTCWYHFPLWIPAGASLGVRARTAHTAAITTGRVVMYVFGKPKRPEMWWCGSKVESLGINAGSSKGTNVTPGNAGAWGAWTTIGTSTARYSAVQLGVNGTDATAALAVYHWQIGVGSQPLPGSQIMHRMMSTSEVGAATGFCMPIWCDVADSTVWQARATCDGSAEIWNVAIYGVY